MPTYAIMCWSCDWQTEVVRPISKAPTGVYTCPKCGDREVRQFWPKGCNVVKSRQFEPYIEMDITGEPIEITGPEQRDRVLEEHGCTMDSISHPKRRGGDRDKWEDDVNLEKVMEHIDKHGTEAQEPEDLI